MENGKIPFEIDFLTNEMIERAKQELSETEEIREKALMEMRMIVKEETKLYCPTDDKYLLQYLRARKFQVKRAYGLLQNYYHVKKTNPDVYGKINFVGIRQNISEKIINIMPYRDYDGSVIIILQLYNWNVDEMKFSTFVHAITCTLLGCVDIHPATQVCGIKIIVDTQGMGLSYVRHVSPRLIHLIGRGLVNCLPVRFKAIHFINQVYAIQYFWNVVSLILSDKIKNRVVFHSNNQSLHKYINPELLPEKYSGSLHYDNSFWIKKTDQLEGRYLELMKYGYKSSKNNQDELAS